jgi:glycine/D-amino acid oxidase-like deaminating enzyme
MPDQTDILLIGQGICGTFLSYELERAGLSYILIDEERSDTASRAAAGLINPVTGRRLVKTWLIDELLPFIRETYGQLGSLLGGSFLEQVAVTDFFPTAQMRLAFLKRLEEDASYLQLADDEQHWAGQFRYDMGYGLISPCYLVDMQGLLAAARKRMREKGVLREEKFEREELQAGEEVRYRDISARRIIFCDGVEGFHSPYFSRLPWAPNKGEALLLDIPELRGAEPTVFKKGISLAPWQDGLYWAGSSYEWSFENELPTEAFRQRTEAVLREWLKLPFRTVRHIASVRPATLERRPFVGLHPVYPAVGILNGMGTKGCSLAPYFARQLVQHLAGGETIRPEVDVRRFSKVLSRG